MTGAAGFIGSCYVLKARQKGIRVITLDNLTYSGNLDNLTSLEEDREHIFVKGDIGDYNLVSSLLDKYKPDAVLNFAAESHVDRSILDPEAFIRTNVLGTTTLLRACRDFYEQDKKDFRFLHVSTDEVFGTLSEDETPFSETTSYSPNSPYSASKAASDHVVRAWYETYDFPVLITNCSNNYGPRQFPEKLIPLIIHNALEQKNLPIYGTGCNIRDWLHVEDHCNAIALVLEKGRLGESYCIGGHSEKTNIEVVTVICRILDDLRPRSTGRYESLIRYVSDRPGHDLRYAINCSKIEQELGWKALYSFDQGIKETVNWYIDNQEWTKRVISGAYRDWIEKNYEYR